MSIVENRQKEKVEKNRREGIETGSRGVVGEVRAIGRRGGGKREVKGKVR